jgi:putative membrane protein
MRWIWVAIVGVFAAAVIVFILQNHNVVSLSFFRFNIRAPVALLVGITYVVGAVTGGSLFALLRRSYRGSKRVSAATV